MILFLDRWNRIKIEDRRESKKLSKNSNNAIEDIIKL